MVRRSKSNNYYSPPVQEVTPEQLEAAVKACEDRRKAEEQKVWEKKMEEREEQFASLPSVKSVAVPQQPDTESVPLWKDILIWVFAVLTFLFYVCTGIGLLMLIFSSASRRSLFWAGWILFKRR
jgi:hypothetical protein